MTINFVVKCLQGVSTCSFSDLLASCDSAGEVEAFVMNRKDRKSIKEFRWVGTYLYSQGSYTSKVVAFTNSKLRTS